MAVLITMATIAPIRRLFKLAAASGGLRIPATLWLPNEDPGSDRPRPRLSSLGVVAHGMATGLHPRSGSLIPVGVKFFAGLEPALGIEPRTC